ncbi:MAG: hypothetical protein HOO06_09590 [Bdellovibrionaceae bacterium]|jgi:hypothetical protein|nr:hypothetical protein [Pseudobdellovibrionaceae bacterium]
MRSILILLVAILLSACSTTRAPSLNMLEKRSDYSGVGQIEDALSSVNSPLLVPQRTKPIVTDIWVHPHEMPTGDYFRGGWIRTVISKARWEVEKKRSPLIIRKKKSVKKRKRK